MPTPKPEDVELFKAIVRVTKNASFDDLSRVVAEVRRLVSAPPVMPAQQAKMPEREETMLPNRKLRGGLDRAEGDDK